MICLTGAGAREVRSRWVRNLLDGLGVMLSLVIILVIIFLVSAVAAVAWKLVMVSKIFGR